MTDAKRLDAICSYNPTAAERRITTFDLFYRLTNQPLSYSTPPDQLLRKYALGRGRSLAPSCGDTANKKFLPEEEHQEHWNERDHTHRKERSIVRL